MLQTEFTIKFQELISEYRTLAEEVKRVADDESRKAIMLQMQDNVRRQNTLRKHYQTQEN